MSVVRMIGVVSLGLLATLAGCGGDDDGGGGEQQFATIRGRITPGPSFRIVSGYSAAESVDTSKADAIWAIPGGEPRRALEQKIVLALDDDGSFAFTPNQQGTDYILALVDSAACTNATARNAWNEDDIDARTNCILGYVSIPDAESAGSMVLIPTSSMTEDADVGDVAPSTSEGDEADTTSTLQDLAPSFSVGLGGLQDLARVDDTLKALIWSYANTSDDGSEWYSLTPNYNFFAPDSLEAAITAETSPEAFLPQSWTVIWESTVDTAELQSKMLTPGYLQFVAPHSVNDYNGFRHYKASEPMGTDFIVGALAEGRIQGFSESLVGAGDGIWEIHRDGGVVAKFDLRTSSPFDAVDGVMDLSKITGYVPTLELETDTGGAVTALKVRIKTWDGENYLSADASNALDRFGALGATLTGDGSAGCVGENEFTSNWNEVSGEVLTWNPANAWVIGQGSESACGVTGAVLTYRLFGSEFTFAWRQTIDPFTIVERSGFYLGLDPDNGVTGTYASFRLALDNRAEEWRSADVWLELSDISTTPTDGLVKLGAFEDGIFHLLGQTSGAPSFYLEYAGTGSPPASFETSATLTVHDGRPGRSQRSIAYPVSWSNTATPNESATLSINSYESLPSAFVGHGGQREIGVFGSISGMAQGDHMAFSPASVAGWPADEYELVSTRVLLLDAGTLNVAAPLCFDAACTEMAGNPADGLAFYAAEAGDFDFQAFYTVRWTGEGSGPTLSSMVWNAGAAFTHALASDNAAAPSLQSTTPTAQMLMTVSPSAVSISDGPLRVEYTATISHGTIDGFYGDTISIELPTGATVIPRTSVWQVGDIEESLPEPAVAGTSHEWPHATFIFVGTDATLRFEAFLAPTEGEQGATGQAWVGNTAVDITATLGDDVPAFATVTVNP